MNFLDFSDKKLIVFGDIHGDFKAFFHKIKQNLSNAKNDAFKQEGIEENEKVRLDDGLLPTFNTDPFDLSHIRIKKNQRFNNAVIVVAGDCGFGFNKFEYYIDNLKKANADLAKNNTYLLFLRGNHDDPSYFNEDVLGLSNIKTIKDYTVLKTLDGTTLCIGGGISIDRIWRKQEEFRINKYRTENKKQLYWADENIVYNEEALNEILKEGLNVNSIITHVLPQEFQPKIMEFDISNISPWLRIDEKLQGDIKEESDKLMQVYNFLTEHGNSILWWAHGHYHVDYSNSVDIKGKKVVVRSLGICQYIDGIKNWASSHNTKASTTFRYEWKEVCDSQAQQNITDPIDGMEFLVDADVPQAEGPIAEGPMIDF